MCLSVFRAFKWSGNTHYKDYATSYICFEPDFLGASLVIMFSQVAHDAQKGNKETIYVKMLASVLTPMSLTTIGILLSLTKWAKQIVAQPSDGPLGHGFSRVEFASPDLFLRCNVEGKQHDTSCLLLLDKQNAESNDNHPCAKYHVEIDNTQKLYLILLLYQLLHQLFSSLLPRLGLGCSATPRRHTKTRLASYPDGPSPLKIELISCGPMAHISDIKLIRTDTTLDLSQKAEKDEIGSNVENANVATAQGRSQLAKLQRPKDQIHLRSQYILFRRRRGVKRLFKRCSHGQKRIVVHAPYVDIYVADSYFSKHDNLVDSKFEDFTAHDILSNACVSLQGNVKFAPKLTVLHQKLIGEGSHRRLSSSLRLKKSSESISSPPKSCEVIIVERLPSGVFADPFELQHLVQRGVFRDAAVFGDTNLELP
ncbi:hypothetical protein RND71_016025 [Anisodus tanguticus]|uniref:Uncharacterized protein n=1 Tax=Anisodus tanguticus TaxID=243964 RepID=A0AAE1S862_9SOLA|nr:hypothetical protein RND71_016025 [Anisodus tanguticus]